MSRINPTKARSFSRCHRPIESSSSAGVAVNSIPSLRETERSTSAASFSADSAVGIGRFDQSAVRGMLDIYPPCTTEPGPHTARKLLVHKGLSEKGEAHCSHPIPGPTVASPTRCATSLSSAGRCRPKEDSITSRIRRTAAAAVVGALAVATATVLLSRHDGTPSLERSAMRPAAELAADSCVRLRLALQGITANSPADTVRQELAAARELANAAAAKDSTYIALSGGTATLAEALDRDDPAAAAIAVRVVRANCDPQRR